MKQLHPNQLNFLKSIQSFLRRGDAHSKFETVNTSAPLIKVINWIEDVCETGEYSEVDRMTIVINDLRTNGRFVLQIDDVRHTSQVDHITSDGFAVCVFVV